MPKIRAILEYANFLILFILYVLAIENMEIEHMNTYEIVFIVYALAFSLDKSAAIREHGLKGWSSLEMCIADFSVRQLPGQRLRPRLCYHLCNLLWC